MTATVVRPCTGERHAECALVCQQAEAYGVWPEHSCSPVCVWLKHGPCLQYFDDRDEPFDEPECDRCHGDGMDPWNDYLLPCPACHVNRAALESKT